MVELDEIILRHDHTRSEKIALSEMGMIGIPVNDIDLIESVYGNSTYALDQVIEKYTVGEPYLYGIDMPSKEIQMEIRELSAKLDKDGNVKEVIEALMQNPDLAKYWEGRDNYLSEYSQTKATFDVYEAYNEMTADTDRDYLVSIFTNTAHSCRIDDLSDNEIIFMYRNMLDEKGREPLKAYVEMFILNEHGFRTDAHNRTEIVRAIELGIEEPDKLKFIERCPVHTKLVVDVFNEGVSVNEVNTLLNATIYNKESKTELPEKIEDFKRCLEALIDDQNYQYQR